MQCIDENGATSCVITLSKGKRVARISIYREMGRLNLSNSTIDKICMAFSHPSMIIVIKASH